MISIDATRLKYSIFDRSGAPKTVINLLWMNQTRVRQKNVDGKVAKSSRNFSHPSKFLKMIR